MYIELHHINIIRLALRLGFSLVVLLYLIVFTLCLLLFFIKKWSMYASFSPGSVLTATSKFRRIFFKLLPLLLSSLFPQTNHLLLETKPQSSSQILYQHCVSISSMLIPFVSLLLLVPSSLHASPFLHLFPTPSSFANIFPPLGLPGSICNNSPNKIHHGIRMGNKL